MNELTAMSDWIREFSRMLEVAYQESMQAQWETIVGGNRQTGKGVLMGARVRGYWVDEVVPPILEYPGLVPVAPSWLEPKCAHWHDWTFPVVHVDA